MFSVIIPLYNKQKFIERALNSVLAQTFQDFEVIVVDDGSTDESFSLACSFDDTRIKVITQENQGAGAARNTGIKNAVRPWVALLDADDAWTVNHLEELNLLISKFESDDIGIAATKSIEIKAGQELSLTTANSRWRRERVDYFKCSAKVSSFIHSSAVAIKCNVFDQVGFFNNYEQGEDTELWTRICLSFPCVVSNKPTSFYFRGTGGIMETLWLKKNKEHKIFNDIKSIGPSVSFLVKELEVGNIDNSLIKSVIIYINSKITISLKVEFYNGRYRRISRISDFYIKPLSLNNFFWSKVGKFPTWLLFLIYEFRCFARKIYHYFKK